MTGISEALPFQLFSTNQVDMTAQFAERIILDGGQHSLCTDPLETYFEMSGNRPEFEKNCTALWRGYVGTWEILADRLYLVGLQGRLKSGEPARLANVFPGYPDRVFAHWYSGTLRIPKGQLLRYVHGGYASVYEQDQFIPVKRGIAGAMRSVVNAALPGSDASEDAYAVHAMYVFSDKNNDAESSR